MVIPRKTGSHGCVKWQNRPPRTLALLGISVALTLGVTGCASVHHKNKNYSHAVMSKKIKRYTPYADSHLAPYFKKANVAYPPKKIALLIFKNSKRLELYATQNGHWTYIRDFPIYAASGKPGPKLHVGDRQVPEGVYHIIGLNPQSRFDLSMHLDYPNAFDRRYARLDGRHHLGGNIYIHGKRRSIGCVAIGDSGIESLFPLVYHVGIKNVEVIIAPNDFRESLPIFVASQHVPWVRKLYLRIDQALALFPLHRTAHANTGNNKSLSASAESTIQSTFQDSGGSAFRW